jgi:hippurate hydrolase
MDAEHRELAERRIRELAESLTSGMGATHDFLWRKGYPVMVNSTAETDFAAEVARDVAGEDKVSTEAAAIMGGEDFAFMLEERPGAYILTGNGDSAPLHHPKYNFNDDTLLPGASYWTRLIEMRLPLAE